MKNRAGSIFFEDLAQDLVHAPSHILLGLVARDLPMQGLLHVAFDL
jgi:hypothetical protein